MLEPLIYEHRLTVAEEHLDPLGHVNNLVYLEWVLDIAVAHWMHAAPEELRRDLLWVVRRHEVDYKASALLGEQLLLRTWIEQASRLTFQRRTQVIRAGDERVLVRALTTWCPIDVNSRKLRPVSDAVRRCFFAERSEAEAPDQAET